MFQHDFALSIEKDCRNNKKRKEELNDDDGGCLQVGEKIVLESMLEKGGSLLTIQR